MKRQIIIGVLGAVLALPVNAQGLSEVADGLQWNAAIANGPTVAITLNPNGTGAVKMGPVGRDLTWRAAQDGLCIANLPRSEGPRCFALSATAGGYLMTEAGGNTISLTR